MGTKVSYGSLRVITPSTDQQQNSLIEKALLSSPHTVDENKYIDLIGAFCQTIGVQ